MTTRPACWLPVSCAEGLNLDHHQAGVAWENSWHFHDTTTAFLAKWCPRNNWRNSILWWLDVSQLGSTSDWLKQIFLVPQPITHTSQIWILVKCHVSSEWNFYSPSQTSFQGKTSGSDMKCCLFSQSEVNCKYMDHYIEKTVLSRGQARQKLEQTIEVMYCLKFLHIPGRTYLKWNIQKFWRQFT